MARFTSMGAARPRTARQRLAAVGRRRRLAMMTALSMVSTLLVTTPLPAAANRAPSPAPDRSVPVGGVAVRDAGVPADRPWSPSATAWPAAGAAVVRPGTGFTRAFNLPVSVAATPASGRAERAPIGSVRVEVLGQEAAARVGLTGVLLRLTRADGVSAAGGLSVRVDYSAFAEAIGGAYASRLRLVRLPGCALTTPQADGCLAGTELPTVNNTETRTVSADVPVVAAAPPASVSGASLSTGSLAEGSTLVAVTAAVSGDTGTFAKTSFALSYHWQAGTSGGEFAWDYPMRVPPAPGGLAPEIGLGYSSGSVDGRTNAENTQGSWVGEGWNYQPGYIERSYRACLDDTTDVPSPTYTNATGDLCWRDENATIVWNGHSTELIRSGSTWRLADDDGSRVEKLTGAGNYDNNGEYWRITATDGTRFYFGLGRLPGWVSGKRETHATWNAPVFANKSSEPCYSSSSFAASHCIQAWRWNLDYVVDNHGNTMSYWYTKDQARTGLAGNANSVKTYDRGGWLSRIEYGTTYGTELANTTPPLQVVFGVSDRCLSSCWSGSTPVTANWRDTPWDLDCKTSATSCPNNVSPSFWITKRLTSVTTQYRTGSAYQDVDRWDLAGNYTDVDLWLASITHTGKVGGSIALPAVSFAGTMLANRTDAPEGSGISVANHRRITTITNENGGQILVTYQGSDCTATSVADPDNNSKRCFPQYWKPPTQPAGWAWWNKYRVTQVVERDLVGGQPDVVHGYAYSTSGASTTVLWHHSAGAAVWSTPGSKRSWADFRGWPTITITTGASGQTQSKSVYKYFRGLKGDDTDAGEGTRTSTLTVSTGQVYQDDAWLAGQLLEQIDYDGAAGHDLFVTIAEPWGFQTGSRVENPDHAYPSHSYSYLAGVARERTRTWLPWNSTYRQTQLDYTHENAAGRVTAANDQRDTAVTGDELCVSTTYAQNTTSTMVDGALAYLLDYPAQQTTTDCTASPGPANTLGATRTFYDGTTTVGAAPTRGLPTRVDELVSFSGSTANYITTSRTTFDAHGRPLDVFDGVNRKTTTAYTPATGAPPTAITVTDPAGYVTTTTVDPAWGLPMSITDPNTKVSTGQYDALGRLIKVWQSGRPTTAVPDTEYAYTFNGTSGPSWISTKKLGPNGNQIISYELFDGLLRPRQNQTTAPDGKRVVADTAYDGRGLTVKKSVFYNNATGPTSSLVSFADPAVASQHRYVFDGYARPTSDQLWSLGVLKWQTDTFYQGDRTAIAPPPGAMMTQALIDTRGNTIELRKYQGRDTTFPYDATTYTYDRLSRLLRSTDPAGNRWDTSYDLLGRKIATTEPDKGTTLTTYDNADQVLSTMDARGMTLAYTYDNLGRRTGLFQDSTAGTQLVGWTYDTLAKGELTSSTRHSGGDAYTVAITGYDDGYRPLGTSVTIPTSEGALAGTWTTSSTYAVDGSLASTTYPLVGGMAEETVTNTYTDTGFVTGVSGVASYLSAVAYAFDGQVTQRTLGSGANRMRQTLTYDDATRRLTRTEVHTEHPGAPDTWDEQLTELYGYDPAGNVTGITETSGGATVSNQCFGYDYLQRMTEAWTTTAGTCQATPSQAVVGGPDAYWQSYTFDKTGNRLTLTDHSAGGDTTRTSSYPAAGSNRPHAVSQIVSTGPGGSSTDNWSYDPSGNVTGRRAAGQALAWDPEGHLASVTVGAQVTSYVYDAAGNRLLARNPDGSATAYAAGFELKRSSGGALTAVRFYTAGGFTIAARSSAGLVWLAGDKNGTAQVAVDAATLAATKRRLDPYGNPRGTAPAWPTDKGFVGGTQDPTGLIHLGAREFDPANGRFVSVDPVVVTGEPQQLNAYAYGNNSPVTFPDPDGQMYMNEGGGGSSCTGLCNAYATYYGCPNGYCTPKPTSQPSKSPTPTTTKPPATKQNNKPSGSGGFGSWVAKIVAAVAIAITVVKGYIDYATKISDLAKQWRNGKTPEERSAAAKEIRKYQDDEAGKKAFQLFKRIPKWLGKIIPFLSVAIIAADTASKDDYDALDKLLYFQVSFTIDAAAGGVSALVCAFTLFLGCAGAIAVTSTASGSLGGSVAEKAVDVQQSGICMYCAQGQQGMSLPPDTTLEDISEGAHGIFDPIGDWWNSLWD